MSGVYCMQGADIENRTDHWREQSNSVAGTSKFIIILVFYYEGLKKGVTICRVFAFRSSSGRELSSSIARLLMSEQPPSRLSFCVSPPIIFVLRPWPARSERAKAVAIIMCSTRNAGTTRSIQYYEWSLVAPRHFSAPQGATRLQRGTVLIISIPHKSPE